MANKTLNRDKVLKLLKQNHAHLTRMGVLSLGLFGSLARQETTSASDVDILVELVEPVTFDRYMDVRIFLEDLLGCRVDLVLRDTVRPPIRPHIEKDLILVA